MKSPLVTVLLPAFNAGLYLEHAVDSILQQSFTDLELLIVDDGSSDGSLQFLEKKSDPRVRVLRNEKNRGLIASLNRGISEAKGTLIARMDADDFALPDRLKAQVMFMKQHPEVAVCGTQMEDLDGRIPLSRVPVDSAEVKAALLFSCAIAHPTVMLRKAVVEQMEEVYDPSYPHAEDYALWAKLSANYSFSNLDKVGLRYRLHAGQVSRKYEEIQKTGIRRIHQLQLERIGVFLNDVEADIYFRFSYLDFDTSVEFVSGCQDILLKVFRGGIKHGYQFAALKKMIGGRWYGLMSHLAVNDRRLFYTFISAAASKQFLSLSQQIKLLLKLFLKK